MIDIECQQNLLQQAPKWKLANHGLKSRNDEVGIIKSWSYNTKLHFKQSRGDCMKDMKDQHRFWN